MVSGSIAANVLNTGNAGYITLQGGAVGDNAPGTAGTINVEGGGSGNGGGAAGSVLVKGGAATGSGAGGHIELAAGSTTSGTVAGHVWITGGNALGLGGEVKITAGDSQLNANQGGKLTLQAGAGTAGNSPGGDIHLTPGAPSGTADPGSIIPTIRGPYCSDAQAVVANVPSHGLYYATKAACPPGVCGNPDGRCIFQRDS